MQNSKQVYIDTIASTLVKKKGRKEAEVLKNQKLNHINKKISTVLHKFDSSVEECKKYNEAKIHRKYESKIDDLEQQVKVLTQRVKIQQQSRSPSKKYVEQLLDQLVYYRSENEELKKELKEVKNDVAILKTKEFVFTMQNRGEKDKTIEIPQKHIQQKSLQRFIQEGKSLYPHLQLQIRHYLKKKQRKRKNFLDNKSAFCKFLSKWITNDEKRTFQKFLQTIDNWSSSKLTRNQSTLNSQLKSHLMNSFEYNPQITNLNIKTSINANSHTNVKTNEKKISPYFSIAASKSRIKTIADTRVCSSHRKNLPTIHHTIAKKQLTLH